MKKASGPEKKTIFCCLIQSYYFFTRFYLFITLRLKLLLGFRALESVRSVNDNDVNMFQVSRHWSPKRMFAGLNKVFSMSNVLLLFPKKKLKYSFHHSNPTLNTDLNTHSKQSGGKVDRN